MGGKTKEKELAGNLLYNNKPVTETQHKNTYKYSKKYAKNNPT